MYHHPEVRCEIANLDFGSHRAIAPDEVEQERNANSVRVFDLRGVDNDRTARVASECVERGSPDRRDRVGLEPSLELDAHAVARKRFDNRNSHRPSAPLSTVQYPAFAESLK